LLNIFISDIVCNTFPLNENNQSEVCDISRLSTSSKVANKKDKSEITDGSIN